MKFMNLLNRLTLGRATALGLAAAAIYYFVMYDSGTAQLAQIASAKQRIQELQQQIESDQQKLDRAAVYKRAATEVGGTIMRLLSLIPENFKMSDLMRIISNEAKTAGSSLDGIKPGLQEISSTAPEFEELTVSLDIKGSFLQHMVFLSNLTKVNQILIVRQFEFSHVRDGKGEEPTTVNLNAEIVAFRYRGEQKTKEEEKTQ
jgi:Tfp pilus assembly protein PilO